MHHKLPSDGIEMRERDEQFAITCVYMLYISPLVSVLQTHTADQLSNLLSAFDMQPAVASH